MGVEAADDDGLDAQFLEQDVEVGLEEAAVTAFRNDEVFLVDGEFGNDFRAGGSDDGVVAPDLEFTVDAGTVSLSSSESSSMPRMLMMSCSSLLRWRTCFTRWAVL